MSWPKGRFRMGDRLSSLEVVVVVAGVLDPETLPVAVRLPPLSPAAFSAKLEKLENELAYRDDNSNQAHELAGIHVRKNGEHDHSPQRHNAMILSCYRDSIAAVYIYQPCAQGITRLIGHAKHLRTRKNHQAAVDLKG